jgi:hypothetical protein
MTGFVSMNLFAGLRNPSWRLSDTDAARFKHLLTNLEVVPAAGPQGERGFARRAAPAYAIAGDVANVLDGADLSGLVRAAPLEEDDQSDVLRRPLSGFRGFNVVFDAEGAAPQWFETYDRLVVDTASGSLRRDHGSPTVEQMLYESAPRHRRPAAERHDVRGPDQGGKRGANRQARRTGSSSAVRVIARISGQHRRLEDAQA